MKKLYRIMNTVCKGMALDCSVHDKAGIQGTEMKTSLRLCLYTWADTSDAQTFP